MKGAVCSNETIAAAGFLTVTKFRDGKKVWQSPPMPNKVVSGAGGYGRNIIARVLAGDNTYTLPITSASVGSGSTAPADGDTNLQTPVLTGITLSNATVTNNVVQIDVFVADGTLANGIYREFGLFSNGRLFARILISPAYTKASGEDTLFSYTLTITG